MILLHSIKRFTVVHYFFPYDLKNASNNLYQVPTMTAQAHTESLLNDGNTPDGHSYDLHRVLTLAAQTCTERLPKDGSAPCWPKSTLTTRKSVKLRQNFASKIVNLR